MARQVTLLAVFFTVFCACESRPDTEESGIPNGTSDTADMRRDNAGRTLEGEDSDSSTPLGVRLQTLLDSARDRDPDSEQLDVLDRLNDPVRVSIETQANRHVPGQTDTLRTRHYDGVSITVYHVSGGKELLKSVVVTDPGLESPEGARVGMPREEVEHVLGNPSEHQNGTQIYLQDGPIPTRLYVYFENDTLSRIEWLFPID